MAARRIAAVSAPTRIFQPAAMGNQHPGCSPAQAAATLQKKHLGEIGIIVLAGVNQDFRVFLSDTADKWCCFNELGTGPYNGSYFHGWPKTFGNDTWED